MNNQMICKSRLPYQLLVHDSLSLLLVTYNSNAEHETQLNQGNTYAPLRNMPLTTEEKEEIVLLMKKKKTVSSM